jgi:beta-phosphoglucomutase family hydrolase
MLELDAYAAILFDMDGTLIDSVGPNLEAWQKTCEHFGYPWDFEWMYALGGVPTITTVEIMNQHFSLSIDPNMVSSYKESLFINMDIHGQVFQNIFNILLSYHGKKPVGIGTGASRDHALHQLKDVDILPLLDVLVTASDVKNGKPYPDTYLKAAKSLGVAPNQCVVFEDTETGAKAAAAAGMDCYVVYRGEVKEFRPAIT